MIRISDYIVKKIVENDMSQVFLVTGGGAMFLNDSIAKEKKLSYICNHHEQASAMAAEAYTRISGKVAFVNVTTGPGGINALNGVFGAYTDSIPMIIISGQVKRETLLSQYNNNGLRQLGDQEVDIISIVKPITKFAIQIDNPNDIKYYLEKALFLAQNGRPGPCWIDIPIDVQSSFVDEENLKTYKIEQNENIPNVSNADIDLVISKISKSLRPVILVGNGIRISKSEKIFEKVIEKLGIPVTTAWTAHDIIDSNNELYCGRPGFVGDRAGNFVVQNSDLLIVLGSRLGIRQLSYNWNSFARESFIIHVDIDEAELTKPFIKINMPIISDLYIFLEILNEKLIKNNYIRNDEHVKWLKWSKEKTIQFPVFKKEFELTKLLNPYLFFDKLFNKLTKNDIIVCSNGAASVMPFQVGKIKKGQRLFSNAGSASMGYELPAAIGAAVAAKENNRVICLAGDGSIQMNLQELQTIKHYNLNIIIFVINNNGYLSIRTTQKNFFNSNFIGESKDSGISFPDLKNISKAYGFKFFKCQKNNFENQLNQILSSNGPILCEVIVDPSQGIEPRLSSKQNSDGSITSPPLEDMYPFLSSDELNSIMMIKSKIRIND